MVGNIMIIDDSPVDRKIIRQVLFARTGGDEFLIVLSKTTVEDAEKMAARIKNRCSKEKEDPIKPNISMGCASMEGPSQNIMEVYKIGEDRMYKNKLTEGREFKNSIMLSLRQVVNECLQETDDHSNLEAIVK